jgi:hypothetical protein
LDGINKIEGGGILRGITKFPNFTKLLNFSEGKRQEEFRRNSCGEQYGIFNRKTRNQKNMKEEWGILKKGGRKFLFFSCLHDFMFSCQNF